MTAAAKTVIITLKPSADDTRVEVYSAGVAIGSVPANTPNLIGSTDRILEQNLIARQGYTVNNGVLTAIGRAF